MRKSMSQNQDLLLQQEFPAVDQAMTARLAQATAALARDTIAQDANTPSGMRILLHGGLGVGKTTWVRDFLRACGVTGRIKSPSFSVAETYDTDTLQIHHLDFYRESNPQGWQGGGLRDLIAERAITLIEWPEHAAGLPPADIDIWIDWADQRLADGPRRFQFGFYRYPGGFNMGPLLPTWQSKISEH
jgi:tRNA threonylcarbamoyladenosine biosynthesis protein TsaE